MTPLLAFAAEPNRAVALLLIGILLACLELNKPGTVVYGCTGVFFFLVGVAGLRTHELRPGALLLLLAGVLLFAASFSLPFRVVTQSVATVCLMVGLRLLTVAPRVNLAVAILAALVFSFVLGWLVRVALRARHNKILVGTEAFVGRMAVVHTPLSPGGKVEIQGELRPAILASGGCLPVGSRVLVDRIEHGAGKPHLVVTRQPPLASPGAE